MKKHKTSAGEYIMAYCKNCGAYIPDNMDKCIACGFSESEAKAQSEREAAEEKRREQQRAAEQWAKEEKERRDNAARESKAASAADRESPEYYINKVKEAGNAAEEYLNKAEEKMKSVGIDKTKVLAALSYLSFLWLLPYILCADNSFARFHAKQGLILFLCNCVLDLISIAAPIMWIARIAAFLLMLVGIKNALTGEKKKLPFIGNIF